MRRLAMALALAALILPTASLAGDDDQRVANTLAANLRATEELKGFQIKVLYRDGVARLEGWVRNKQQAQAAERIVNRTPEVQRVLNQLEIKGEPAPARPAAPAGAARPQRLPPAPDNAVGPAHFVQGPALEAPAMRSALVPARDAVPRGELAVGQRAPHASPRMPSPQMASTPHNRQGSMPAPRFASARTSGAKPAPVPSSNQGDWGRSGAGAQVAQAAPRRPQPAPMPISAPQEVYYPQGYPMPYQLAAYQQAGGPMPVPAHVPGVGGGAAPAMYDQPYLPNYAWPTYAAYPNYAALTYPKQYSPPAWPYIGPFYPYPQVPLGWRKVTLEWDDGWWFLNFSDDRRQGCGR